MKNTAYFLVLLPIVLALTACAQQDYSDLEAFVSSSGEGLRGHVDPVPEVKPYQFFTYEAFDVPNPFVPRKSGHAPSVTNGIQPDLNRRKEILETFPLESLAMVGTLQKDEAIFALIKSPDGTLHRVKVGSYLGQDYGKIDYISESEIKLMEIVQDGVNEWTERISTLMLKD